MRNGIDRLTTRVEDGSDERDKGEEKRREWTRGRANA